MYKTPGSPIDVWRENLTVNASSFNAAANSDDWRQVAQWTAVGPRQNLTTDTTDYPAGTIPQDSWSYRVRFAKTGSGGIV